MCVCFEREGAPQKHLCSFEAGLCNLHFSSGCIEFTELSIGALLNLPYIHSAAAHFYRDTDSPADEGGNVEGNVHFCCGSQRST